MHQRTYALLYQRKYALYVHYYIYVNVVYCFYVQVYYCICVHVHSSSSSSSCRAASTDIPDLSVIASNRSSGLHILSSQSCCMYVRAGCPAFVRPYEGVHRGISLMSSSLLLQPFSACLVRLTWLVFQMGSKWLYSWFFVRYCLHDLFNIALILTELLYGCSSRLSCFCSAIQAGP